ncbi:MAG: hypothetical protein MZV70_58840 [Desulfobacterales bacterium]|nr:hypothetical protein [Desulfobacterales bacterium]
MSSDLPGQRHLRRLQRHHRRLQQPAQAAVIWDEAMQGEHVLMGAGNNGISVWRRIFNPDGTPFSAWEQIMTNVTPGPISPVLRLGRRPGHSAFKEVSFFASALNGANVITNLQSLSYTVRAAGDVHAMATELLQHTGKGGSTTQFNVAPCIDAYWGVWRRTIPAFITFRTVPTWRRCPSRWPVVYGEHGDSTNIYLNFQNFTGQSELHCAGRITAVYTAKTLP